jgi:hypothetical protein
MSECHKHTPGDTTLWIPKDEHDFGFGFGLSSPKVPVKVCTWCGALFFEHKPVTPPVKGL